MPTPWPPRVEEREHTPEAHVVELLAQRAAPAPAGAPRGSRTAWLSAGAWRTSTQRLRSDLTGQAERGPRPVLPPDGALPALCRRGPGRPATTGPPRTGPGDTRSGSEPAATLRDGVPEPVPVPADDREPGDDHAGRRGSSASSSGRGPRWCSRGRPRPACPAR